MSKKQQQLSDFKQAAGKLPVTFEMSLPGLPCLLRAPLLPAPSLRSIRCDAAMALAGLRDEMGQPVGEESPAWQSLVTRLCKVLSVIPLCRMRLACRLSCHSRRPSLDQGQSLPLSTFLRRCRHAAGLPLLLEFYKSQYFVPGEEDVPRSIAIADPSEYYVAQAVATAGM
jgi:hypothetical protein